MGGFQAVTAGLGQAGEDMGKGLNDALNQALKVQFQNHTIAMGEGDLALRQAAQRQTYDIAQQAHDLTRSQIIAFGWKDLGTTLDPTSGQYTRTFYNEQTKETSRLPVQGTPPDSPAGLMSYYKSLSGMQDEGGKPMFTPLQAKQIAFKMPQLYREGPAGMMEGFRDYAMQNLGMDEKAAQKFAQTNFDIVYGRGGYFHYGAGGAKSQDMSGWTANEQREYKSMEAQVIGTERMLTKLAETRIASSLDPTEQADIQKELIESLGPLYKQLSDKQSEISGRHGRGNPPSPGAKWSKGAWAAANPGKDANAAEVQARQAGASIVP